MSREGVLQIAFVESFNGRLQDECLNEHIFADLAEARKITETWRIDYNTPRPHTSLGGLAPAVYSNLNCATRPTSLELRKGSAPVGNNRRPGGYGGKLAVVGGNRLEQRFEASAPIRSG